ncbi:hypothetical protein PDO_0774 [Rhizobium sp. PDO1-076]|uniref:hypothetical protein n=1 Tax=Rhizobium sp. PDO1-076 TaxID=1125979 RepID=UPI00024E2482|nr:hypothetical protein [Rhizobium sp. PDO1-076]EHS48669.1 hypothetical protein PDO_0774 [Rhizobium sp. PDO1-076]
MNRFASALSASAISALAFGGDSYAAMPATGTTASQQIEQTITGLTANHFDIIRLDELDRGDPVLQKFETVAPGSQEARMIQASVIANKSLSRRLQSEKVELTNIVGAERASDGTVTFYLR